MAKRTARRLFMLDYGAECVPKSVSVAGAPRTRLWLPVVGALVETAQGPVLLDGGFSAAFLADAEAKARVYRGGPPPRPPAEDALGALGVLPGDLALAAVSHLHCDHTGELRPVAAAGKRIAIHADELAFAQSRATIEDGYYAPDYEGLDAAWHVLDGDTELADGVVALATPGHTPGHLSFRVDLPQTGTWLLAFDAADLGENVLEGTPPGWTALPEDAERAAASLARLRGEAERLDARLVPGHDAAFWRAIRHPPGGHP